MMNIKLVICSGIMAGLVGIVFGLAVSKMSQRKFQCCQLTYLQDFDEGFSKSRAPGKYAIAGAGAGFVMGSLIEMVRQNKPDELDEQ